MKLLAFIVVSASVGLSQATAQTNFWYWETSAPWESPYWSLGMLPGSSQSVAIPNPGYKAVALNYATVANHPESLTISNLHVSAPDPGFSTLLLNHAGLAVPFRVRNGCTIGRNGMLMNLYSDFRVEGIDGGVFRIGPGSYVQEGGLVTSSNVLTQIVQGEMRLTNAVANLGEVQMGMFDDTNSVGSLVQAGGVVIATIDMRRGQLELTGGELRGSMVVGNTGRGSVHQYGGTNFAAIQLGISFFDSHGSGSYYLHGGGLDSEGIDVGDTAHNGWFEQWGGILRSDFLAIGPYDSYDPALMFVLHGGSVRLNELHLMDAIMDIAGGEFIVESPVDLIGSRGNPRNGRRQIPTMRLSGGLMSVPELTLSEMGTFVQTGGTNLVGKLLCSTYFSTGTGGYQLRGGFLRTSNTVCPNPGYYFGAPPPFLQEGGTHVTEVLNLDGWYGIYEISSGTLIADVIVNRGDLQISDGPTAPVIKNPGTFELGGFMHFCSASQTFGKLLLSSNSIVWFGPGNSTLSFGESKGSPWAAGAVLRVENWRGSFSGTGAHRLLIGDSTNAMTEVQVGQVQFVNPSGLAGVYSAKLLASGELVPAELQTYTYAVSNGSVSITGYRGPGGRVTIPDTIEGKPVVALVERAFSGHYSTNITALVVADTVSTIGTWCFLGANNLTTIWIGKGLTHLSPQAFSGSSLAEIIVDPQNTAFSSVDGVLFNKDATTLVHFPRGKGESYSIPAGVEQIGDHAFAGNLQHVSIPDSVRVIGTGAFASSGLSEVKTGNGLEVVGASAFSNCNSLTNVMLGGKPAVIGDHAFYQCFHLATITTGGNVATIGSSAFEECYGLTAFDPGDRIKSIGSYAFKACLVLENLNLGLSLTNIGDYAFWLCGKLSSVTIPATVSSIGLYAFRECRALESVRLPDSLQEVSDGAFFFCVNLKSVTFGERVKSIGRNAFGSCSSLTSLVLPSSLTSISDWAFSGCSAIQSIYFRGDRPSVGSVEVFSQSSPTLFYLPGTTGWEPTIAGRPTARWMLSTPMILSFGENFGVVNGQFGFVVSWASNAPVVLETSTGVRGEWVPYRTNALYDGWFYFSESILEERSQFYRARCCPR